MEQSLILFVIVVITKETRHTYTALVKDKCYAYCYVKKLICNHDHDSDMFYSYLV